ncbi:MAG TPA: MATE family efflux transporter, partial [Fibrobacteres bacterium]|nr:MATE family efflux transporter [Fibrobacterota bacterium]
IELAASNIAFRINSIIFFPVVGLSIAISILVGQAQGAKRPDLSVATWKKGLVLCEAFTALLALCYILFPYQFYSLFHNASTMSASEFSAMASCGAVMLRCVAIYCLFDTTNIITLGLL